ncbi:Uncharacterized protein Fot_56542 [Forsythia ovata]|uniref:Uncharacterized protein n=1 Tax=Forsythia ovata TaxID=205694 RepID=A0ABD1NZX1_9LAMI
MPHLARVNGSDIYLFAQHVTVYPGSCMSSPAPGSWWNPLTALVKHGITLYYISKRPLGIRSHSRNSSRLQVGTTIHHVKTEFRFVFEGDQKDSMKTGHTFEREKD